MRRGQPVHAEGRALQRPRPRSTRRPTAPRTWKVVKVDRAGRAGGERAAGEELGGSLRWAGGARLPFEAHVRSWGRGDEGRQRRTGPPQSPGRESVTWRWGRADAAGSEAHLETVNALGGHCGKGEQARPPPGHLRVVSSAALTVLRWKRIKRYFREQM